MLSTIILKNMVSNLQLSLLQDINVGKSSYLFKNEEVDWGSADAQHNTYTYPGQVGSYISSTNVKERTITIKGYITYSPTKKELEQGIKSVLERYATEIRKAKMQLSTIINPLQELKVMVGTYYIIGKPDSSVKFSTKEKESNEYFCKFTFSLYCSDPLFKRNNTVQTILSGSEPAFRFPLVLKKTGFIFGRRYSYSLISVDNEGDIPIGGLFIIEATGTVKNIKVENVYTGEFFIIYKTLEAGEKIVVNTIDGIERSITGETKNQKNMNYFEYWGYEGTWLQFAVGSSLIGYSVAEGSQQSVNISFEFNPQKYNLGDT